MKIGNTLYFDFQATTPVDPRVLDAMCPYFNVQFGNPHSADHSFGWQAAEATENARRSVSALIGADTDEIFFTSGATESNNLALMGLVRKNERTRGTILIGGTEHKSVIAPARECARAFGVNVEVIPVDAAGVVDLSFVEKALNDDVLAVSVMAINNEVGTMQPLKAIGDLARKWGTIFHCDAAQAGCALDIDVFDLNVDLLSISSHKIYGPKGVGAIYVRREIGPRLEPLCYGGGQENHLRPGTVPVPLCVGLGKACELLLPGMGEERKRVGALRDRFVERLSRLPWPIHLNGPAPDFRHPGNANLRFEGFSAHDILAALQPHLAASTGSACTSGTMETSYVLEAIGLSQEQAESSIRFSLGRFTDDENIDDAVDLIEEALRHCMDFKNMP